MIQRKIKQNIFLIGNFLLFLLFPFFISANFVDQKNIFFIDPSYDLSKREQISAILIGNSSRIYFYVDNDWWNLQTSYEQTDIKNSINSLSIEFENKIYPVLTSNFGYEPRPGIDKDEKITILIHPMINEVGGYFNSGNEYYKLQNPKSNEREMIFLNAIHITSPLAKTFLAHEFMHLISFNQKDILKKISEETWLNEARSIYMSTLLGYDDVYEQTSLESSVTTFLKEPSDSITDWQNKKADYGALNLFVQYLNDHYNVKKIFADSLQSSKIGIDSINEALKKNSYKEDFSQIFTNWTIAVLINDCEVNQKYCYLNPNLKKIKLIPQIIFLPTAGESSLSISNFTKNWAGNWYKIVGGKKILKLEFQGDPKNKFKIPYLVENYDGKITLDFLKLDEQQKGIIYIPDFQTKNMSLIIIPSAQSKFFESEENPVQFSFVASVVERTPEQEAEIIKNLLIKIEYLKNEIAKIKKQILAQKNNVPCKKIENDLYFGMRNNLEVRCLQEFLKKQGTKIYPEGLITGNFLFLTQKAVKNYQKENGIIQTGYFGRLTRNIVNQKLSF